MWVYDVFHSKEEMCLFSALLEWKVEGIVCTFIFSTVIGD